MKKIHSAIVILSLFSVNLLYAQTLVKENRVWSNSMYGTERPNAWQNSNWIKFEGESTINDTVYKNIYRSDNEFRENWYHHGFIREDSTKKVFIRQNNRESLLYDFNLNVGDSIFAGFNEYFFVTNIDTIEMQYFNTPQKQFYFGYSPEDEGYYQYYSWIEGIGSLQGILSGPSNMFIVGAVYHLVCFTENDTLKYRHEYHSSCFPIGYYSGMEIPLQNTCNVKVGYGSDFVTFTIGNFGSTNDRLKIFDISGKLIEEHPAASDNTITISKSRYEPGIYVFIYSGEDYREHGKFVITHY
jgi:hypothetical protein